MTGDERTVANAADPRHFQRAARAKDLVVLLGIVSVVAAALLLAALLGPAGLLIGLLIKGRLLAGVVGTGLIALEVGLLLGVEVAPQRSPYAIFSSRGYLGAPRESDR